MTNTALYLNYGIVPFLLPREGQPVGPALPFINTIRRHHAAHHNTAIMMEQNST